jgi:hypothetical protein
VLAYLPPGTYTPYSLYRMPYCLRHSLSSFFSFTWHRMSVRPRPHGKLPVPSSVHCCFSPSIIYFNYLYVKAAHSQPSCTLAITILLPLLCVSLIHPGCQSTYRIRRMDHYLIAPTPTMAAPSERWEPSLSLHLGSCTKSTAPQGILTSYSPSKFSMEAG